MFRNPGNLLVTVVLALFAAIISIAALKALSAPYVWIMLVWILVILCGLVLVPGFKTLFTRLIVVLSVLSIVEAFFWVQANWEFMNIRSEGTFGWAQNDLLGYTANKSVMQREAKYYKNEKVYDVTYTMNSHGYRITLPYRPKADSKKKCVLFFGDSYTYGWGLNDNETVPYLVSQKVNTGYDVYNLSFMTHGPQQMLAMLEFKLIDKVINCKPNEISHIIYQTTADHVRRAAGIRDKVDLHHGPQYAIAEGGKVVYQGQFGDVQTKMEKIKSKLSKSFLYRWLVGGNGLYSRGYKEQDVELYFAILNDARMRFGKSYPQSSFHILAWGNDAYDNNQELYNKIIAGLEMGKYNLHKVNDILPGADNNKKEYFMGKFDFHPNPTANNKIAEFITEAILK